LAGIKIYSALICNTIVKKMGPLIKEKYLYENIFCLRN